MDATAFGLFSGLGAIVVFSIVYLWRTTRKRWRLLAGVLGLKERYNRLFGSIDGFGVVVHKIQNKQGTLLVEVGGRHRLGTFQAKRNDVFARVSAALGGEYLTGDAAFDKQVLLQGDDLELAAAMTQSGRATLQELLKRGLSVGDGFIGFSVPHDIAAYALKRKILTAISAAKLLAVPKDDELLERLVDNALHDSVPGVRRKNLSLVSPHAKRDKGVVSAFSKRSTTPIPR